MTSGLVTRFIPIRQSFPHRRLNDVPAAVQHELTSGDIVSKLKPGSRVAIGVGSRGISNLAVIMRAVVEFFQVSGMRPFLFPAMGSHGAASAEGQASVLAHYGIDNAAMGCPVVSRFEVTSLGKTPEGIETFAGKDAWESDGIFVINRVKWHTSFEGEIESGVAKMLALGVGKIEGAQTCHGHARKLGMTAVIRSVAGHLIATGKIVGGLAILEDAYHDTAQVAALPADELIARESELLGLAKSWKGRLPVPALDVLIVDEIGKNISGTGMDLKVVNRGVHGQYNPYADTPSVERIYIRSLSELSYGNGVGIGLADVIHDRVLTRLDVNAGRINARTSGSLAAVRTPLHFPSDRECLDLLYATVGKVDPRDVTVGWISNTLALGTMAVSENLAAEFRDNPEIEIAGPTYEPAFDKSGNM
ncbi:MAG TPA: hypothetical protein VHZ74_21710 [Bryobacteraceae bacterium]|nr:hypothetical protein [Bryobacteraceae bacterium]